MIKFAESNNTNYPATTIFNCKNSDLTIAFAVDFNTRGQLLTKRLAGDKYVAISLINFNLDDDRINQICNKIESIICFSNKKDIIINIAGNGTYTPEMPNQQLLDEFIHEILKRIFNNLFGYKIVLIRSGGQSGVDESGAKAGYKLSIEVEVLAPKDWRFKNSENKTIYGMDKFLERFKEYRD